MEIFGRVLFVVGALFIVSAGIVGIDVGAALGGVRVGNFPGMLVGMSLMVSGAIFVSTGKIVATLNDNHADMKVIVGIPEGKIRAVEKSGDGWSFAGIHYSGEDAANAARNEYVEKFGR